MLLKTVFFFNKIFSLYLILSHCVLLLDLFSVAALRIFFRGVIQIHVEDVDKDLFVNIFFFILIIMIILMRSFKTYDPKEDFF